jgi:hypothetical protein
MLRYNRIKIKNIAFLSVAALAMASCGQSKKSLLKEAPDAMNLRSAFAVKRALNYDAIMNHKTLKLSYTPWADTYWPLTKKELAARWGDANESRPGSIGLANFLETFHQESQKQEPSATLSPAEKYDIAYQQLHQVRLDDAAFESAIATAKTVEKEIRESSDIKEQKDKLESLGRLFGEGSVNRAMTMAASGWSNFVYYSADEKYKFLGEGSAQGEGWGWMGICHGWAPASVMEKTPKHSVMAEVGDKKILFSEGDIRGLLSKAWAQEAPGSKQYFLGRRCEKDVGNTSAPIPANSNGRGYTGNVTLEGKAINFIIVDSLRDFPTKLFGRYASAYRVHLEETNKDVFLIESGKDQAYVAETFSDLVDAVSTGSTSHLTYTKAEFYGCWDVNPASFHEVLVEQLAVRDTGFVMDRTRNGQVWNQPVYAADFTIGDLKPIGSVKDVARPYRATGTAYVAEVRAAVHWSREPHSQQLHYSEGFDEGQSYTSNYEYTLEFDADKNLIGGEWGTLSKMDAAAGAPDFLFGYEKGAKPLNTSYQNGSYDAMIDYTGIVSKLHDCSLSAETDGTTKVMGTELAYKNCKL